MQERLQSLTKPKPEHLRGEVSPNFSLREIEVLQLIATGARHADIAKYLGITLKTIQAHQFHIHQRLIARDEPYPNTRRAVILGVLEGLIEHIESAPQGVLSKRETEIIGMAIEGMPNAAIAHDLFISTKTVETHLQHAKEAFGAKSNIHAIAMVAMFLKEG